MIEHSNNVSKKYVMNKMIFNNFGVFLKDDLPPKNVCMKKKICAT